MVEHGAPARTPEFAVCRFSPQDRNARPHLHEFGLRGLAYGTLFLVPNRVRKGHGPGPQLDFACRSASCGGCGVIVNGRPALSCRKLTAPLPTCARLHPPPMFELAGNLPVDTGRRAARVGWRAITKASGARSRAFGERNDRACRARQRRRSRQAARAAGARILHVLPLPCLRALPGTAPSRAGRRSSSPRV